MPLGSYDQLQNNKIPSVFQHFHAGTVLYKFIIKSLKTLKTFKNQCFSLLFEAFERFHSGVNLGLSDLKPMKINEIHWIFNEFHPLDDTGTSRELLGPRGAFYVYAKGMLRVCYLYAQGMQWAC